MSIHHPQSGLCVCLLLLGNVKQETFYTVHGFYAQKFQIYSLSEVHPQINLQYNGVYLSAPKGCLKKSPGWVQHNHFLSKGLFQLCGFMWVQVKLRLSSAACQQRDVLGNCSIPVVLRGAKRILLSEPNTHHHRQSLPFQHNSAVLAQTILQSQKPVRTHIHIQTYTKENNKITLKQHAFTFSIMTLQQLLNKNCEFRFHYVFVLQIDAVKRGIRLT